MKKIKLKDIDNSVGTHEKIRDIIFDRLSLTGLLSPTALEICFHSLNCFNFRREISLDNHKSIEQGCRSILQRGGLFDALKSVEAIFEKEQVEHDLIQLFLYEILNLEELPYKYYFQLRKEVEKDLKTINNVIKFYEENDFIKNFKEIGERPRDHYQRTLHDFYLRCSSERDLVLNYYLDGISNRALQKANRFRLNLGIVFTMTEQYRDRPYRVWIPFSERYFDYRRIDTCSHRVGDIAIQSARSLVKLYETDKDKFYAKLKVFLPPSEIFKQINEYYLKILPSIANRQSIFDELKFTFEKKKWISFSSLAIIQVEGLFSDMLNIVQHNKKSSGSLPDKVNSVRPNYYMHESHFDYFQYYLPNMRNSFLHYGIIKNEEAKTIAHDLLYDLHYILKVFHELEAPLVELKAILKKSSTNFLFGITDYNHLFDLVEQVRNKSQFSEIESDWILFEKDFLTKDGLLEYYAMQLSEEFPSIKASFISNFKVSSDNIIDLEAIGWDALKSIKDKIVAIIRSSTYLEEELKKLDEINMFLNRYNNMLPNCSEEASKIFKGIKEGNEILKKFGYLIDRLKAN